MFLKNLKIFKNLFTQWKILYLIGKMSNKNIGAEFKLNFEIKSNRKEHLLLTLCQNYSTECFLSKLKLNKNGNSPTTFYSQAYSMQQIYNLFLDSGRYTATFISRTEIKNGIDVCARIFYSKSNKNLVT